MKSCLLFAVLCLGMMQPAFAAQKITCTGILIEMDMTPRADFPMAVVYDNSDSLNSRTCVLDLGHAGHWPLRGACWLGEKCILSGSYYKKIGNTYYMRAWDKAEAPDHRALPRPK